MAQKRILSQEEMIALAKRFKSESNPNEEGSDNEVDDDLSQQSLMTQSRAAPQVKVC